MALAEKAPASTPDTAAEGSWKLDPRRTINVIAILAAFFVASTYLTRGGLSFDGQSRFVGFLFVLVYEASVPLIWLLASTLVVSCARMRIEHGDDVAPGAATGYAVGLGIATWIVHLLGVAGWLKYIGLLLVAILGVVYFRVTEWRRGRAGRNTTPPPGKGEKATFVAVFAAMIAINVLWIIGFDLWPMFTILAVAYVTIRYCAGLSLAPFRLIPVYGTGAALASRSSSTMGRLEAVVMTAIGLGLVMAAAMLAVAASSAPGWLWESEAHGFDVLEYHLQLPREWMAMGRVAPMAHNVYSYLPSYMETAYLDVANMLRIGASRLGSAAPEETFLDAEYACQFLHAMMAGLAAFGVSELVSIVMPGVRWASWLAGLLVLALPWTIVTGSMAYDEMPLLLFLGAGLVLIVNSAAYRAWHLGLMLGLVAGAACGAKLTAAFFVAAPLAVTALLVELRRRRWRRGAICMAAMAGAWFVVLAPYFVRNWIAADGNPVFPFATSLFGSAHWTPEQVARWQASHAVQGGFIDRLSAFWTMAFMHPQWAGLWFAGAVGGVAALIAKWRGTLSKSADTLAAMCSITIVIQIGAWLAVTHLQSRFLLPAVVPLAVLTAVGAATIPLGKFIGPAFAAFMLASSLHLYESQRGGYPASAIDTIDLRTGAGFSDDSPEAAALASANSDVYLNLFTDPTEGLYLLGDSTPLYITRPIIWHTTYDASPLGELIRAHPDEPAAWQRGLREAGIRLVLVNWAELHRLSEVDHWYDPDVTQARVHELLDDRGRSSVVARWPATAADGSAVRVLYRLLDQGEGSGAATRP